MWGASMTRTLPVTLVIVSDYEPGPKTWADEDAAIRRYTLDDLGRPAEIIVAASTKDQATPPPDWSDLPSDIRVIYDESEKSSVLKDAAAAEARHDLIAVIEADCIGLPGWLKTLYDKMMSDQAIDVVSGRTMYAPTSALRRVAGCLDRAYLEQRGPDGRALHVSNNGALYRRAVLDTHKYGDAASPFVSATRRNWRLGAAGVVREFTPEAVQYHEFGGWGFAFDVRRNKALKHYLTDGMHNGRFGRIRTVLRCVRSDLSAIYRSFGGFCRPWDLPLALIFIIAVIPAEWRGATMANDGLELVEGSSYR